MKIEINNNLISVDNYKQIKQIENDLIVLQNVKIIGKSLNIKHLDQHLIVVEGIINNITSVNIATSCQTPSSIN